MKKEKEEKKKKKKVWVLIILLLLLIGVTGGYSLLSSNLKITGFSRIGGANWNVHFSRINVLKDSVKASKAPEVTENGENLSISYDVDLRTPGDFYEFTVDVVNDGAVDARLLRTPGLDDNSISQLNYINSKSNAGEEDIIIYSITCIDNQQTAGVNEAETGMTKGDILTAKTRDKTDSRTYKIRVEYNKNITREQMLKSTGDTLSLRTNFYYEQA